MATLTIALPLRRTQTAFNLRRWAELLADPELAKVEGRIETDPHGQIIMSPPPAPRHGSYQSEIAYLLRSSMPQGRVLTECPISTADGVKAADVAWASTDCLRELGNRACFSRAPEICVEILSPGNTDAEMQEKTALYCQVRRIGHTGVRPSSGAASFGGPGAVRYYRRRRQSRVAAPEDGRTPVLSRILRFAQYFDAGAGEVWICSTSGAMKFLTSAAARPLKNSRLCPQFPKQVELR